jgi:hypothetical protein
MPLGEWGLEQVYAKDLGGRERLIVEEELAANPFEAVAALKKLEMLKAHGWPGALTGWHYNRGTKNEPRIELVDSGPPAIYLLKCKPSCWRIYFHVVEEKPEAISPRGKVGPRRGGTFLILRIVCKKKNKRDPGDLAIAKTRVDAWRAGRLHRKKLSLPGE